MLAGIIDWIKDIVDGIKDRFKNPFTERNSTPFAGAFLIAVIIYNWQLFYSILYFEDNVSRMSRISIIQGYLDNESLFARIGHPLWISFASIIFYYVFNNISLGVTTIFNRWFKASVLYFTDRSKIITREEFERANAKTTRYKSELQIVKKEASDIEEEFNKVDKQLTELTESRSKELLEKELADKEKARVNTENTQLRKQLEEALQNTEVTFTTPDLGFEVLYAKYGKDKVFKVVTELVNKLLITDGRFVVDNKVLGGDPLRYTIKELQVFYRTLNQTTFVTANEGDQVSLDGNLLNINKTKASFEKEQLIENMKDVATIFEGEWVHSYQNNQGKGGSETVIIDSDGRYFANGKHTFNLSHVVLDKGVMKVTFNKIDLEHKLFSKESWTRVDNNTWAGSDSKGYKLNLVKKDIIQGGGRSGSYLIN